MNKQITTEELKKLSKAEVLNEIRKILAFDKYVISSIRSHDIDTELVSKLMNRQHYRFEMSGFDDANEYNNKLLEKFRFLGIFDYHRDLSIQFYKGTGEIIIYNHPSENNTIIDISGYGTVEILYKIFELTIFKNLVKY